MPKILLKYLGGATAFYKIVTYYTVITTTCFINYLRHLKNICLKHNLKH